MHYRLNCLSGSVAGKSFEFNLPQVLVGREPGCQLKLDGPSENRISGRHCELFEQDGKLYVRDLDSLNGTLVDDVRIDKPTVLRPGSRLQLGAKGAVFVYEPLSLNIHATMANTMDNNRAAPLNAMNQPIAGIGAAKNGVGLQTMERKIGEAVSTARMEAVKAHAAQKKHTSLIAGGVLLVALLAAGAVWNHSHQGMVNMQAAIDKKFGAFANDVTALETKTKEIADRVAKNDGEMRAQLANLGKDLNEKSAHLAELEAKLDKETALNTDEREKLKQEIEADKSQVATLGKTIEDYQKKNEDMYAKAVAPFKAVAENAKNSIYSVFKRNDRDEYVFRATAFAINVEKGLLGTNAHVSDEVKEMLDKGKQMVVRCNSNPRFTYHIKRAYSHPDYIRSEDGRIGRQSADVGVLELDLIVDGQTLAMPGYVHPASPEELDKLNTGDVVALLGFPGDYKEDYVKADGSTNVAKMSTGVISGKTSFTGMKIDGRDFDMVELTCAGVGGNSGSPVFSADGRIVSIFNSGKAIGLSSGTSVSIGAVRYGISIRYLKQLLDTQYGPGMWN